jgi:hypothetical protein
VKLKEQLENIIEQGVNGQDISIEDKNSELALNNIKETGLALSYLDSQIIEKHQLLKSFCNLIIDNYPKLKKILLSLNSHKNISSLKRQSRIESSKENFLIQKISKITDWEKNESNCFNIT